MNLNIAENAAELNERISVATASMRNRDRFVEAIANTKAEIEALRENAAGARADLGGLEAKAMMDGSTVPASARKSYAAIRGEIEVAEAKVEGLAAMLATAEENIVTAVGEANNAWTDFKSTIFAVLEPAVTNAAREFLEIAQVAQAVLVSLGERGAIPAIDGFRFARFKLPVSLGLDAMWHLENCLKNGAAAEIGAQVSPLRNQVVNLGREAERLEQAHRSASQPAEERGPAVIEYGTMGPQVVAVGH